MILALSLLALAVAPAERAAAQSPVATTATAERQAPSVAAAAAPAGDHLTIYLMTMGIGAAVWERFGHNAIWVHDDSAGTDLVYN